ncbi:MAG TPA: redoxin family protein [Chitinophagaceae bacterium]|nr:redoxin family protein [Chitinophagaceae bacterium]
MSKLSFIIIFSLLHLSVKSQNQKEIGEKLPSFHISNVINYPSNSISDTDLKGKPVIFDFWSSWCTSCVSSILKLDTLQSKFKAKVLFFLVTSEDSTAINKTFKRFPYLRNIKIPVITKDTFLKKLFPHQSVPHVVWVDTAMRLKAITKAADLQSENISLLIDNRKLNLELKEDIEIDYTKSIREYFLKGGFPQYSTTFTRAIPRIKSRIGIARSDTTVRIYATNVDPFSLYAFAYKKEITLNPYDFNDKVIVHCKKRPVFKQIDDPNSYFKNAYCYELSINYSDEPVLSEIEILLMMQKDLDKYFGLSSGVKLMNIPCLIVKSTNREQKKPGPPKITEYRDRIEFVNQPARKVLAYINKYYNLAQPIIYDSKLSENISLIVPFNTATRPLKKLLEDAGYELYVESRRIKVLEIHD